MVMNSNAAYFKTQVQSNEKIKSCRPKDPIIPNGKKTKIIINIVLGLSLIGSPWLTLSTPEGKARGSGPWPLNHTIRLFVPIKEASPGIEPRTKP